MNSRNATCLKVRIRSSLAYGFTLVCVVLGSAALTVSAQVSEAGHQGKGAKIFVDPDVRVSYDGDVVHMEAYVAASATNPDLLVAGGELIVPGRALSATEARLYRSSDAGASWTFIPLPNEVNGGWDNAVAGGMGDTAYFLTSNLERGLTVYYTYDGGKTWASTVLKAADDWDRPHIVVDVTTGLYRGRLYVAGEASDGVRVTASADGGQTFTSPVTACPRPHGWNAATTASPLVLSDGTLAVPCAPYPNYPERAVWSAAEVGLVTSSDGGQTFTPYRKVGIVHRQLPPEMYLGRVHGDVIMSGNFMQGPSFAVAPPGARFADRIYAAWQDIDSPSCSQLVMSWSGNRGLTWSAPARVDSTNAPCGNASAVRQGVPMLNVNREGVVGIAWFDASSVADGKSYDVYFSASLDGGRTFLPPTRVSSATSEPAQGLNVVPAPGIAGPSPNASTLVTMTSPFSERATGGDYSSMAVDAAGRFHPFWTDARKGAWQLYSATVRVLADQEMTALATHAARTDGPSPHPCATDSSQVQLLFGAPEWDGTASEVVVPVRLRNTSPNLIADPISVRVSLVMPKEQLGKLVPDAAALVPRIFDSFHSSFGDSATFVYPISLAFPLFPNGITFPLNWRLKVKDADFMNFSVQAVVVTGGCSTK